MDKKYLVITAVILAAIVGFIVWPKDSCGAEDCQTATSTNSSETLTAETINAQLASGQARLIDVREPDEYAAGHAVDAELIPLGDIEAGKLNETTKDKKLYLYCRSGRRAGTAKTALESQGYTNIINLGGLDDWQAIGGAVAD